MASAALVSPDRAAGLTSAAGQDPAWVCGPLRGLRRCYGFVSFAAAADAAAAVVRFHGRPLLLGAGHVRAGGERLPIPPWGTAAGAGAGAGAEAEAEFGAYERGTDGYLAMLQVLAAAASAAAAAAARRPGGAEGGAKSPD